MTTSNTVNKSEIPVDSTDPTKTAWGSLLSTQYFFVLVNGTDASEVFDAADISAATQTRMASYGRGISVVMGGGDDTVIASGFGDTINAGAGTNYIDGGANAGTTPDGGKARDVLNVFAASSAAAAALQVTEIAADAAGADGAAYTAGYRIKVSNGAETDYLKNVEQINVFRADDNNAYVRTILLAVDVHEIAAGGDPAGSMHHAWAQGTERADSFNAQTDVSGATQALMTQHGRGVYVDMGAGNDTVVGSGFGDDITLGSGTNYADGGANAGTTPWGGKPQDVLHVIVADAAAAAAVQVIQLAAGSSGLDAQAFTNGYTHKVVAGNEIDYVKGIERVSVQLATGNGGSTWVRDIPLETVVHEADLGASDLANYGHLAWASGTAGNDVINAADLLSNGVKAKMAELQKGIWIDGGSGNDTITGTAYGDNIRNGSGNAKIDGGANAGGMDVFEISVDSTAAMGAVQVAASDDPAYTWMVTYGAGAQKDYLKNIEAIMVNVAGTGTGKWIPLAVQVHEIAAGGDAAASMHHAWAQGTDRDDSFDAASVSNATKALMTQHGRGVYADMGAGNDTVVGSGFGDDITLGSGTNYADGGANAGTTPWGGKPQDVLHVIVANAGAAAAVQVVQLAAGLSGVDAQAFASGYTHKVVAGNEIDYIKGIERVSVQVAGGNGGSTWVRDIPLETVVHEADLSGNLAGNMHLAWVNGTAGNDVINAADLLSNGVKTKMGELQKGVWIDGGSGNDTITGTGYGDNIRNGSGNAKIDGGANTGGKDVFEISVDSIAAMDAVVVAASDDPAYSFMVSYGNGQKDYLKNIEAIAINVTGSSAGKWIPLALELNEIGAGADLANASHFAWAQGTERADSFDAATVSSATQALMTQHGRGVYANMGAGDDTVKGSGYGDHVILGAGTNYFDGGLNAGSTTWGGKPADVLQVNVASLAAASAVQVLALSAGMSGADAQAFADGYTHKVVAGSEIDYLKNVERVTILVNGSTWVRDVALAVQVQEAVASDPNIGGYQHLAWVNGTAGADSIDVGGLLSDAVAQQMAARGKGVWIDAGAGNDTIVASAYGDNIVAGSGVNYVDGGANQGSNLSGGAARDVLEMFVATQAEADAVAVTVLGAGSTGADLAAFNAGYKFRVANGTAEVNYVKNVEQVNVMIWTDKDGDGQRDGLPTGDPANELTLARGIALVSNSAPTFAGAPAGVAIESVGAQYVQTGGAVLASGKLLSARMLLQGDGSPSQTILARHNADGSVDTTFGGGTGRVVLPTNGISMNPAPVELANGKIMLAVSTPGSNFDFRIMRVNPDGSLDASFGNGGSTIVNIHPGSDLPTDILVQPDGKVIVAGWGNAGVAPFFMVATRLNTDGSLDTSFGSGGKLEYSFPNFSSTMTSMALQGDKLVVAGFGGTPGNSSDAAVLRFNSDGSLDTGFATNGVFLMAIGTALDNVRSIVILPDGKILVGGTMRSTSNDVDGFLLRLNANGSLDTSFGSSGVVKAHLTDGHDVFAHIAVQPDGRIIAYGSIGGTQASGSLGSELMVVRYLANGQLDTSFGANGIARVPGHGIGPGTDPGSLVLVDGKIVIFGTTMTDITSNSMQPLIARLNADGSLDSSFYPAPVPSVGGSVQANGVLPVALDANAAIYDADLHTRGNYGGASLKLARQGGASSDDLFSAVGEVSFAGGQLSVGGTVIGSVSQSGGTLTLSFNTAATQGLVNRALHGIGYGNRSTNPPDSVAIDWTFSDGNSGSQGLGGELSASATSQVLIGSTVREIARSGSNAANSTEGQPLSSYAFLATVDGSARGESFDAGTQLSAPVRALMAELGRGGRFDLGGGDDTLVATAYGDSIVGGAGVNYIDGGANQGSSATGAAAQDVLEMYVASQAAADAVAVTVLSAASTGADLAAFNAGYKFKVASGTAEINYVKNVEQVNVMIWTDKDGDGLRDGLPTSDPANEILPGRTIALVSNSAPTFAGAAAGIAIDNVGLEYLQTGGTVLANGKLLAARVVVPGDGGFSQTVLARHNADGSIDTSFGGGTGRVVLPTQGVVPNASPVELANGKIMLAISTPGSNFDFRIMRVNADGSLDTSFGDGGSTIVNIHSGSDLPRKILVQPDGKVIVVGWGNASVAPFFMVATRLNTDGSLDTSFGTGGKLQYGFANVASTMASAALQGDKLLVSGYVGGPDGTLDAAVLRFDSNGSLDTSFADNGVFLRAIGIGTDNVRSTVVLPDGKILLGGTMRSPANDVDGFLVRLNANGSLDTSFGSGGVVKAHLTDAHDVFGHVAVQPDGGIIAYGTIGATAAGGGAIGGELMVVRYLANGQLDTSFGNNGITRVPGYGIGVGIDPGSLVLVDGKIVIFGSTINDFAADTYQPVLARLNADGSLDTSFYPAPVPSVGGSVQANGVLPVRLDADAGIYDAELHARGNYAGASLRLVRQGGASGDDLFSAMGEVSFANGQVSVGGTVIGTVVQSGGSLTLSFNAAATQGMVNRAMHGIGYSNGSANPPSSVSIDWIFSDGNSNNQGFGGALSATATSQVLIGTTVREVVRSLTTPTSSTEGQPLASYPFLATVYGSARGESFDSTTQLSPEVRSLMAELGRGARFDLGAGDDTLVATAGSDEIYAGSGTNRIDGGDHAGTYPFGGGPGRDTLHVLVADQAAANAVSVTRLVAGMSGPDAEAFAAGYEVKVVNGSEIDYVKNVEMIKIFRWADANGNRTAEGNELTWMREIPVALRVYESAVSTTDPTKATDGRLLKDIWHLATAEGWERNDLFDALTDVSSTAQQLMAQQGRGIWVDGGAGDDILAGSAYGDNFVGGAGTNYIDGRANGGTTPNGQRPEDVLEIYVDSQARANAVQAIVLDASSTGQDAQAFADGYTWKVVDGDAVNYVKNVEAVNIFIWTDTNGDHDRDPGEAPHTRHIRLSASVNEIARHPTDPTKDAGGNPLSGAMHMAWVNGSAGADSFNAAADISSGTRALMDQYQRGVFVETHAGNDTATGSAYGDNFVTGAGVNRVDGGDNRGTHPAGGAAFDMLEIYVATRAEADAVTVTALTSAMTGADGAAWNDGYRYKVVNGAVSTDYIKNIEQLNVMVWTDKDGDGQRDWGTSDNDPAREISYTRSVGLVDNTAPSFAGTPRGALVRDGAGDYGNVGGVVLSDGKLLSLVYLADANRVQQLALERSLADGSIDTSFGSGGRVILESSIQSAIPPVLLESGKLLVAHRVSGGTKLLLVNQDGSLDQAFGDGGSTVLSIGATPLQPFQVLEGGGKLWVVGYSGSPFSITVARLNQDGSLDTSFSGDGYAVVPSGGADLGRAAQVQADGKLVVVGYAQGAANRDLVALRLNTDGSLDTGFGTGGKVLLQGNPGVEALDTATSMAILPSGKILVGGYFNSSVNNSTTNDGLLVRLNADGSLDTGFGSGGRVRVPGTADHDYIFKVVPLGDGSFLTLGIVGGSPASVSGNGDVTISRFRADGSLDTAFATGGSFRYQARGMGSDVGSLVVHDGKILMFGAVNNDTSGTASALLLRLNMDGTLDTSLAPASGSLGGVTRADGYHWTALDTNAAIYDAELAARGNYGGATLVIERAGGANADDLYGGVGEVGFANGQLSVAGIVVGTVGQQGGRLSIVFNNGATQELVNRALHGIGYANANPAATGATLNWQFSDGNGGDQGVGPALGASGSTVVEIGVVMQQAVASATDASRTTKGELISQLSHLASVDGTGGADVVDGGSAFQPQTAALMAANKRGALFDMGAGDDRVVGTAYGDEFVMGAGSNRVDGADGNDVLKVVVADQAAADAVAVTVLDSGMGGADGDAYTQGYRFKLTSGGETDYLRNVEQVQVLVWQDKDGDRVRDDVAGSADEVTVARTISLVGNTAPSFGGTAPGLIARDYNGDGGTRTGTVLRDGKLLSVNYQADANDVYSQVLERSNPDGTLDTGFGSGGRMAFDAPYGQVAVPLELADGKLLLTTQTPTGTVRVLRLNADGSTDASYGSGGVAPVSVAGSAINVQHNLLDANGKLLIIGAASTAGITGSDVLVMRLNPDGSLDNSFNANGQLRFELPGTNEGMRSGAIQGDGKLVMAGFGRGPNNQDVVVMRLDANGTPDAGFGSGGKVTMAIGTSFDGADAAYSVRMVADGKILVAGTTTAPVSGTTAGSNDGFLMRLNANGSLDTSFGTGGIVRAIGGANQDFLRETAVLDDGSIVTLGFSYADGDLLDTALVLARFRPNGTPDTSFGNGGELRLALRGIGADGADLAIVNGKIVVFGTLYNNVDGYSSPMLLRLNADGSFDTSFVQPGATSLGSTVRGDGRHFTAIDNNAAIFDAELAARGNYDGASVSVSRQGGAQAGDLFGAMNDVSFAGGRVKVGAIDIGAVSESGGQLVLSFNAAATQALVNRAMQSIGYASTSTTPSASVGFNWSFSDGNAGAQGLGGALTATGTSTVEIGLLKTEVAPLLSDPSRTIYNQPMSQVQWMATVNGSARAETFDAATDIGSVARSLMTTHGRGASFDMGGGGDTVTGTGYSDEFVMGHGINRIDGGANAGTHPYGGAGKDELHIYVSSQAQAAAVTVLKLEAGMTGDDAAAFTAGYEAKVVNGGEIDYIRNVERVVVSLWNDADGDRVRDGNEVSYVRDVPLQLRVFTVSVGNTPGVDVNGRPLADYGHFAWLDGWARNDSVNVATDVPEATRTLMAQYGRGVYIDTGAGDDTIVGSAFADNITAGPGTNRVDGGANDGTGPQGGKVEDILEVVVRTSQEAQGVGASSLTASMTGADGDAYAAGYRWKVASAQETDYVKNIEAVNITVWNDANGNGVRDGGETAFARQILMETRIDEIRVNPADPTQDADGKPLVNSYHFAWAHGTMGDDVIDAASISQPIRKLMAQYGRGMWAETGDGNDRVVGSAFGDSFYVGAGVNRIDGGANLGADMNGYPSQDLLDIFVPTQAAGDAVAVTQLNASMTGDDAAAYADGYRWKVVNGSAETDYLKNVEQVNIHIWEDKDGDGQRDFLPSDNPANEMTFVRTHILSQNNAPTFAGAPAGVALVDRGFDFTATRFVVTPDGKTVALGEIGPIVERANYIATLVRHNADGSLDTSFGGGTGLVELAASHFTANAIAVQGDGKLVVVYSTAANLGADFKVVRYLANGSVDTSFGNGGEAVVDMGGTSDQPRAMLVTPDGAIVVVGMLTGNTTDSNYGVVRLTASGQLDTSFNGSGKLVVPLAAGTDSPNSVALQADGKLVVAGYTSDGAGSAGAATRDMAVVRIATDGTLDSSFGSGGKVRVAASGASDTAVAVKIAADGGIVLAGSASRNGSDDQALVRLNPNGSLDTAFGNGGKMLSGVAGVDRANAMVLQADGKILVAGEIGPEGKLMVARYLANGTPDLDFGVGGTVSLTLRGIRDYATALAVVGDKIVVLSPAFNTVEAHVSMLLARLNMDGSLDTSFAQNQTSSLGGSVQADGLHPVVLDGNAAIYDADLVAGGSYGGASLVLERQGGANASDVFSGAGNVGLNNRLTVGGVDIGWVEQQAGRLTLHFENAATQGRVNQALHGIAYSNTSATPPASVTITWTFSDNNGGGQGVGGVATATGSTLVQIAPVYHEVVRSYLDPQKAADERPLSSVDFFAELHGTRAGDFLSANPSAAVLQLMQQYGRGMRFKMGDGDDAVVGTAYSDEFVMGSGVNKVQGGGQAGTSPYGGGTSPGFDTLIVYVRDQAEANAVSADMLTSQATDADLAALSMGFESKIVSGAEVDYVRDVEVVAIHLWTDTNGNGLVDGGEGQFLRDIRFRADVTGARVDPLDPAKDIHGNVLANQWHFAWANGIDGDDMVVVEQRLSATELALMNQYQRGASVNLGNGDDVVTTTAYGDNINVGKGTNWVDGGANGGTAPNGNPVNDVLEINTASLAERKAVSFQVLNASMTGDDARAFAAGYQFKVMTSGETDYVKNVELLAINVWNDANGNGRIDDNEISEQIWVTPDLNAQGVVVIGTPQP